MTPEVKTPTRSQSATDSNLSTTSSDDVTVSSDNRSLLRGLLFTARPKQWTKNILVYAAPAAAGVALEPDNLFVSTWTLGVFLLASIATYFLNDTLDYHADRAHPKKRFRPIAADVVPRWVGASVAVGALSASLACAYLISGWRLTLLVAGYLAVTFAYSAWLKHIAVIELMCVAAGFVMRMIAGGVATDVAISNWFLTVASFGSLFVVTGKRYAEVLEVGEGRRHSRNVLGDYTSPFLRATWTVCMAVAIGAYCQWAFERAGLVHTIWYQLSAVPWVMSLLRYALLLETGHGGAPEEVLLGDRVMQVLSLLWIAIFLLGVYVN